ncbi:hypothetical protein [Kluyvera ascorbata]|uniref:hypothetical protein n=1 Tax=Kluyvera ascorbata TaxID=51288 RepID=UPI0020546C45|nr:hypothetical protein [Kluyvera ascorbata]UPQ70558.1 hypothetical protein MY052_17675 [Kluyvera ascorbata]
MNTKEQFELWAKNQNSDLSIWTRGVKSGTYKNPVVGKMLEAWQAASKALEQQLLELSVKLANVESERAELAAESEKQQTHSEALAVDNAALREVVERMVNQFAMSGISPEEKSINPAKSLMFDAKSALFMPATDAYLAEVRAQGVEMAACALDDVNQFNYANMLDDLAQKLRKGA